MPRPLPNPSAKRSRAGSKRRAAGWMLLTLGLLVAGVWMASGWWTLTLAARPYALDVRRGYVVVGRLWIDKPDDPVARSGLSTNSLGQDWGWNFAVEDRVTPVHERYKWWWLGKNQRVARWDQFFLVLWPLPLLLWTTGGLALWSGRRARRRALEGHCPACGYNLAGLNADTGPCPECGRKAAATA